MFQLYHLPIPSNHKRHAAAAAASAGSRAGGNPASCLVLKAAAGALPWPASLVVCGMLPPQLQLSLLVHLLPLLWVRCGQHAHAAGASLWGVLACCADHGLLVPMQLL